MKALKILKTILRYSVALVCLPMFFIIASVLRIITHPSDRN